MEKQQAMNGEQQQQVTQEMVKNSKDLTCDCGSRIFDEKILLKKLSPLLTQSGQEEVMPIKVIVCDSCGLIPREFDTEKVISDELKTKNANEKNQ